MTHLLTEDSGYRTDNVFIALTDFLRIPEKGDAFVASTTAWPRAWRSFRASSRPVSLQSHPSWEIAGWTNSWLQRRPGKPSPLK
jgi:hypothetical protein